MALPEVKTAAGDRFGLLMQAAAYRLSIINPEMWENQTDSVPWAILDSLSVLPDDTEVAGWLLSDTRPQEILCIVMGHQKLISRLGTGNEMAERYASEAMSAKSLGQAFRIFALYWLNLPLDYHHKSELPASGAFTSEDLAGLSGVL